MLKRIYAIFRARNLEFVRDRGTMSWNLILPVALMFGLSFIFGSERAEYTVGVLQESAQIDTSQHAFLQSRYIEFVVVENRDDGFRKIERHQLDLLIDFAGDAQYWVNPDSPKGYFVEFALQQADPSGDLTRGQIEGDPVRYVDWVLPGILGIIAQVASRLMLIVTITSFVYAGTRFFLDIRMDGSHLLLLLVLLSGAIAMISMGLLIAARVTSEELAGGLLNMVTWPMMMLSGVWFSLEAASDWVRQVAGIFPLTHMLEAARAVMLDGAVLADVLPQLGMLSVMTVVFLALGAFFFRWHPR
jgi:hypothetical protein